MLQKKSANNHALNWNELAEILQRLYDDDTKLLDTQKKQIADSILKKHLDSMIFYFEEYKSDVFNNLLLIAKLGDSVKEINDKDNVLYRIWNDCRSDGSLCAEYELTSQDCAIYNKMFVQQPTQQVHESKTGDNQVSKKKRKASQQQTNQLRKRTKNNLSRDQVYAHLNSILHKVKQKRGLDSKSSIPNITQEDLSLMFRYAENYSDRVLSIIIGMLDNVDYVKSLNNEFLISKILWLCKGEQSEFFYDSELQFLQLDLTNISSVIAYTSVKAKVEEKTLYSLCQPENLGDHEILVKQEEQEARDLNVVLDVLPPILARGLLATDNKFSQQQRLEALKKAVSDSKGAPFEEDKLSSIKEWDLLFKTINKGDQVGALQVYNSINSSFKAHVENVHLKNYVLATIILSSVAAQLNKNIVIGVDVVFNKNVAKILFTQLYTIWQFIELANNSLMVQLGMPGHHFALGSPSGFCFLSPVCFAVSKASTVGPVCVVGLDVNADDGIRKTFLQNISLLHNRVVHYDIYDSNAWPHETMEPIFRNNYAYQPTDLSMIANVASNNVMGGIIEKIQLFVRNKQVKSTIVVSLGWDSHVDEINWRTDGVRFDDKDMSNFYSCLKELKSNNAKLNIIVLLEGGYNKKVLIDQAKCLVSTINAQMQVELPEIKTDGDTVGACVTQFVLCQDNGFNIASDFRDNVDVVMDPPHESSLRNCF
jgi:acetoin utilization deacetylase AcuC-like enzyme